jgi:hypothetical protein
MLIVLVLGIAFVAAGVAEEWLMGSFRHWFDWSWPRRAQPVGGEWVKILCGRLFLVVGAVLLAVGLLELAV